MDVSVECVVIGLAVGWGTLALGYLVCRWAQGWWRVWRYGAPVDHGGLLVEYGRRMTGALDRQALGQLLTVELPRVLGVERAALLLPEAHQLAAVGMDDLRMPVSNAAVRWVASAGEAQRAERGRLRELIRQGRAGLGWTQVWVPLMRGADLRGLWLLGARDGKLQYAPEDLRWLTAVGRQAAVVLEAIHYAEQERLAAAEMRTLYHQVVAAREGERGRLARELHDGVLQDLCAVTRDLKALETQGRAGEECFVDLAARSGEAVQALRAICNGLRPPLLQIVCQGTAPGLAVTEPPTAWGACIKTWSLRSGRWSKNWTHALQRRSTLTSRPMSCICPTTWRWRCSVSRRRRYTTPYSTPMPRRSRCG